MTKSVALQIAPVRVNLIEAGFGDTPSSRVSVPVTGQDGSCFGIHRAAAVDYEQQDGRVVECGGCRRVGHDLASSPGGEGEDGRQPQQAVPAVARPGDADGGDGSGDQEQRGGRCC
jgi:hypothetical protein